MLYVTRAYLVNSGDTLLTPLFHCFLFLSFFKQKHPNFCLIFWHLSRIDKMFHSQPSNPPYCLDADPWSTYNQRVPELRGQRPVDALKDHLHQLESELYPDDVMVKSRIQSLIANDNDPSAEDWKPRKPTEGQIDKNLAKMIDDYGEIRPLQRVRMHLLTERSTKIGCASRSRSWMVHHRRTLLRQLSLRKRQVLRLASRKGLLMTVAGIQNQRVFQLMPHLGESEPGPKIKAVIHRAGPSDQPSGHDNILDFEG